MSFEEEAVTELNTKLFDLHGEDCFELEYRSSGYSDHITFLGKIIHNSGDGWDNWDGSRTFLDFLRVKVRETLKKAAEIKI